MDPAVFLVALITVVGTAAVTIVKVARLWATRRESPSPDVTARLEALERVVQGLQQEQAETQERLDFAERLLSNAREERQIGRSAARDNYTGCAAQDAQGHSVPEFRGVVTVALGTNAGGGTLLGSTVVVAVMLSNYFDDGRSST